MDRKEKIMVRVKKCYEMIQAGKPVRYAYKDAEIDGKTYKKYLNEYLATENIEPKQVKKEESTNILKTINIPDSKNNLKPLKSFVTISDQFVIKKLLEESVEDSIPVAILIRKYTVRSIRDKYKI